MATGKHTGNTPVKRQPDFASHFGLHPVLTPSRKKELKEEVKKIDLQRRDEEEQRRKQQRQVKEQKREIEEQKRGFMQQRHRKEGTKHQGPGRILTPSEKKN